MGGNNRGARACWGENPQNTMSWPGCGWLQLVWLLVLVLLLLLLLSCSVLGYHGLAGKRDHYIYIYIWL